MCRLSWLAPFAIIWMAPFLSAADPELTPEILAWGRGEAVIVAQLQSAVGRGVGLSDPPLYNHQLLLQTKSSLRGSLKAGEQVTAAHSKRQQNEPTFPVGKECLVSMKRTRNTWQVVAIAEATPDMMGKVKLACSIPIGWTIDKRGLLSPWSSLGRRAWGGGEAPQDKRKCALTGRPVLLVGEGAALSAEPVPPKMKLKYGNPDGDGEYQITVTNTTNKRIEIPALLNDGKKILWKESLVLLCQDKVYRSPGSEGVYSETKPTTLKPGESVSTVVNTFLLPDVEWPRGGYRLEFQFCLGEKSVTKSFYYLSRHHDPIREKATRGN